jgi:hypothetical protein
MNWKGTIDLLRRSLYGTQEEPREPQQVGLPDVFVPAAETHANQSPDWPMVLKMPHHNVTARGELLEIRGGGAALLMTPEEWLACAGGHVKLGWVEGPPTLLFRQYAIEHIFDNKGLPRPNAVDRIDVRVFAGTLQCIDMNGIYYFSEPLSKLGPTWLHKSNITRHFLVPSPE